MRHLLRWSVDPDLGRDGLGPGWTLDEGFGVGGVGSGAGLAQAVRPAVMDVGRGEHGDPAVAVLAVLPSEEVGAEGPGVLDRVEPIGKAQVGT